MHQIYHITLSDETLLFILLGLVKLYLDVYFPLSCFTSFCWSALYISIWELKDTGKVAVFLHLYVALFYSDLNVCLEFYRQNGNDFPLKFWRHCSLISSFQICCWKLNALQIPISLYIISFHFFSLESSFYFHLLKLLKVVLSVFHLTFTVLDTVWPFTLWQELEYWLLVSYFLYFSISIFCHNFWGNFFAIS